MFVLWKRASNDVLFKLLLYMGIYAPQDSYTPKNNFSQFFKQSFKDFSSSDLGRVGGVISILGIKNLRDRGKDLSE